MSSHITVPILTLACGVIPSAFIVFIFLGLLNTQRRNQNKCIKYIKVCTSHFIIHTVTAHSVIHSPSLDTSPFTHCHCTLRHLRRVTTHFIFSLTVTVQRGYGLGHYTLHTQFSHHSVYSSHFVYPTYPLTFTSDCYM